MNWLTRIFSADQRERPVPRGAVEQVLAVESALDEFRPLIAADGGSVELVGVDEGVVTLRLKGACQSCASSSQTLRDAIEPRLQRLPFVRGVHTVP